METTVQGTRTPRPLPIVGGHLALDFANTVDDPEGTERYDHAGTYPELIGWSARIGILRPDQADALLASAKAHPRSAFAALRRAHALRHTLIDCFTEIAVINAGGPADNERPTPAQHWADLRRFVMDAIAHAELELRPEPHEAPAAYQLTWPETTRLDVMLGPIGLAALDLLTSPQLSRLKKCAGCPWVFLDQSKNLSRRWCAMSDCGTHEKIRRYVTRRAAKNRA